jgi:cytochrome c oxidase cbb3-type subunit 3
MRHDFFSDFWPLYVAALTIASIVGCIVLLWLTGRKKVPARSDNTTGHVWDEDLVEMNNPLPRWWVGLFILTIVFSVIYLVLYPGIAASHGSLGWTQSGQYQAEVKRADEAERPIYARFVAVPPQQLAGDAQAMAIGERLFLNNCAQCHGSDGRGSKGFPNLADSDWMWGSDSEQVRQTIAAGRNGVMPPMAASVGSAEDVRHLAHYVLSLSGSPHNTLWAQFGKPKFGACAACHGADGKGNTALGAPNLTDKVWLHGWGEESIVAIINGGKNNAMPPWSGRLTDAQIHVLTAYVLNMAPRDTAQPAPAPATPAAAAPAAKN